MKNFHKYLFLNAFLVPLLVGCQGLPEKPPAPETFVLTGKVAVRDGAEQFTANLLWHQRGDGFDMDLWGPLGQGRIRIVKSDADILLTTADGTVLDQGEPEALMRRALGWSLPIGVLPAWVQGGPLYGAAATEHEYDASGRLTGFRELGWVVALERYQAVPAAGGERYLPTRITAWRESSRVRLVVSGWEIGSAG